tara:strand:+ start:2547 stop:3548 length:1002 start_codon:yes stop_codon:yes gene_type:complete
MDGSLLALQPYLKKIHQMSLGEYSRFQNCFKVQVPEQKEKIPPWILQKRKQTKRGKVQGLSRSARKRLLFLINSFGEVPNAFFVTLTVRDWKDDYKLWKKWLNNTLVGLRYHFPSVSGIWRLEFQKRGAPHFHLILFPKDNSPIEEIRDVLTKYWTKSISDVTYKKRKVQVEKVRDIRKSNFYLAVYSSKDAQDRKDIPTGRLWGKINKKELPICEYEKGEVCEIQLVWLKRLYRRSLRQPIRQKLINCYGNRRTKKAELSLAKTKLEKETIQGQLLAINKHIRNLRGCCEVYKTTDKGFSGFGNNKFQRQLFKFSKIKATETNNSMPVLRVA